MSLTVILKIDNAAVKAKTIKFGLDRGAFWGQGPASRTASRIGLATVRFARLERNRLFQLNTTRQQLNTLAVTVIWCPRSSSCIMDLPALHADYSIFAGPFHVGTGIDSLARTACWPMASAERDRHQDVQREGLGENVMS